ncbi:general negative regulator of transcription subunit 5 [Mortierella alpina]|nr:general negative regulator of transcription subunit 5 [Mortierella alpina]
MATRKLQTEIDKVLKKVAEGVETFEETLEKIEISTNANQKEKYESDLKKEIKKLQRLRDQIKTWAASNDIKDKRALMDNRKLIETQMEKFKAIEKEMKTKAYSREGLIMSGRMDPKEKEKAETCSWVTERVESLNIQIEALEAEVETLRVGAKRGKNNPAKERISELEEKIERHKWHQGRLELILRLLENGQIETDKVTAIQEDVNYYDPDFAEDEEIYTDLNLEEEEDFFAVGTDDHYSVGHKDDDQSEKSKDDTPDTPAKSKSKELESETIPSPSRNAATRPTPTKKLSMSEPKEPKPVPTTPPAAPKASNLVSARTPTIARAVETPTIQYATAVAANLPAASESPRTAHISASPSPSPSVAPAVAHASPSTTSIAPPASSISAASATAAPSAAPTTPAAPSPAISSTTAGAAAGSEAPVTKAGTSTSSSAPSDAGFSAIPPSTSTATPPVDDSAAQKEIQSPEQKPQREMASTSQQQVPTAETEIRLPAALADLAHSFETSKERALSKDIGFFASQMLEASFQFLPEQADTERPKYYAPKNPYPTPSYYPQAQPTGLFESTAVFEKFDIDTLFFIFYYQQGTYQQYLAARELKKQSWRFHKKYLTWFQRHEEPKAITDDYEQGTYIYFDYEGAWCQRKKTDFRFEYKFLEDAELV